MPKLAVVYVRCIESFNNWMGKILGWLIFFLVGILLFESVARYGFNSPTLWSVELSAFVTGFYFFIGGGWVLLAGGHVRMDALYSRWSAKKRAIADLATFPLIAIYMIVFMWGGIRNSAYALSFSQISTSSWAVPMAPIKIIITAGAVVILLQGVAFFIRDLCIIKGRPIE